MLTHLTNVHNPDAWEVKQPKPTLHCPSQTFAPYSHLFLIQGYFSHRPDQRPLQLLRRRILSPHPGTTKRSPSVHLQSEHLQPRLRAQWCSRLKMSQARWCSRLKMSQALWKGLTPSNTFPVHGFIVHSFICLFVF